MGSQRRAIGDILMVGSEIDHLISLALFKVAKLDVEIGFFLFGKMALGIRTKHLRALLKTEDAERLKAFIDIEKHLEVFVGARNMFAHGVFLGYADEHYGFFVTGDPTIIDDDNVAFKIKRFHHAGFDGCLKAGQALVRDLKAIFDISMLLEGLPYILSPDKPRSR